MAEKKTERDQILADPETDRVKHETKMADPEQIIEKEVPANGMSQPDEEPKDDISETVNEKNPDSLDEYTNLPEITSEDVTEQKKPSETHLMPGDAKADPKDESTHGPHKELYDVGSKSQVENITFTEVKTADTTSPHILDEIKDDQVDASTEGANTQQCAFGNTNTIAGGGITVSELKKTADTNSPQILDEIKNDQVDASPEEPSTFGDNITGDHKQELEPEPQPEPQPETETDSIKQEDTQDIPEKQTPVEGIHTISPETDEHTTPDDTRVPQGSSWYLSPVAVVIVAALFAVVLLPSSPAESPRKENRVDVFLRQMGQLQARFPHQRADLWRRSEIHLQRHLQMAHPTAPVSLVLTAGPRAEKTLRCLAQALASAFSLAHNASVLHIEGAGRASQDSDQVKLDIDSQLQDAFEGDKPVAIIHRFDELPPGSTLIFYRYCDHENAAYKEKFLIFTVLLEEEEDIPAKVQLNAVEEMVDDHLKKKFLTHDHPVSFDRMDIDKYGGLWSRISHLILPVAAEDRVEYGNC